MTTIIRVADAISKAQAMFESDATASYPTRAAGDEAALSIQSSTTLETVDESTVEESPVVMGTTRDAKTSGDSTLSPVPEGTAIFTVEVIPSAEVATAANVNLTLSIMSLPSAAPKRLS